MPNRQAAALDLVFSALADPTRRAIIARLVRGPASVGELAAPLGMSLPSVLQHLRLLEESGFVASRKSGRVRICTLEPQSLEMARDWLSAQRASWEARLDRLDAFLEEGEKSDDDDA